MQGHKISITPLNGIFFKEKADQYVSNTHGNEITSIKFLACILKFKEIGHIKDGYTRKTTVQLKSHTNFMLTRFLFSSQPSYLFSGCLLNNFMQENQVVYGLIKCL